MRKLLGFLRPYRSHLVIGPGFKLIEAILELLLPLLIAYMIDVGITNQDRGLIWRLGFLSLAMVITGLGCATVCQYTASLASQGFGTDLRNELFQRINHFSLSDISQIGTSSLINRLTNDVNLLQQAVAMLIRLVVRAPFLSIGGLIMAMTIDLRLSLILMLVLSLFILIVYLIMSRSIPLYRHIQKYVDRLMQTVLENLTGTRVIRAFARRPSEKNKFDRLNNDIASVQVRVGRIANLLNPATTLILNAAIAAMLWFGAFRIDSGHLSRGQIIALTNYIGQILVALVVVANLVILYTRAYASAGRVAQILALQSSVQLTGSSNSSTEQKPAGDDAWDDVSEISFERVSDKQQPWLIFDHVQFEYPHAGAPLFDSLDFTLERGKSLGIIGPTGAGKSTLAWLLLRLWPLSSGQIRLGGMNLEAYSPAQLSRMVAIVPQRTVLFSGTIADNLRLGRPESTEDDLWKALEAAQAMDFVQGLEDGLSHHVNRGGSNFSGGQRQRLAIARALAAQPSLLILDDSTSALDYATESALRRALLQTEAYSGMYKIIISQRVAAVQQAESILVMDDGRLVGQGRHEQLIRDNQLYREIWQSQRTNTNGEEPADGI